MNLPRNATNEEIKDRYKQLAIIFHPDKQRSDHQREAAALQFSHIKHAYEGIDSLSLLSLKLTETSPFRSTQAYGV